MISLAVKSFSVPGKFLSMRSILFSKSTFTSLSTTKSSKTILQRLTQDSSKIKHRPNSNETSETLERLNKVMQENLTKNVKVYSSPSKGSVMVNVLGLVGSVVLIASSYQAWLIFGSERFVARNIETESGFLRYILEIMSTHAFRVGVCVSVGLVGIGILCTTMFFTTRMVNHLYLLKGGQSIGLVTDGLFGKEMKFVFDLNETTFKSTRMARKPHVYMKNKRHKFHFMLNNMEGVYHEKEVFDKVICRERNIQ
jgi:hypothetical protein